MKLNSIQFLRAIAALLVVYEHSMDITNKFGASWQQKLYHLDNFGCIGVDLFFVISGFIITYVAHKYNGYEQGLYFVMKRFARINPIYFIATVFCFGFYQLQSLVHNKPMNVDLNKTMGTFMNTLVTIPTGDNMKSFSPLLVVGWTLAFEWLFYLLFFALIALNIKRKLVFLPLLIVLLTAAGYLFKPTDFRVQFLTNPILLEFILGIIICQLHLKFNKIPVWIGMTCLAIGAASYLLLIRFGYGDIWYYLHTISGRASFVKFFLWGLPSSCIVAGCLFLEKNGRSKRLWNNKFALLMGNASYSIYLFHFTLLGFFMLLFTKIGFPLPADAMIWLQMIVVTAISIGFYKLLEKPLLQLMSKGSIWNLFSIKEKQSVTAKPGIETVKPIIS